VAHPAAGQGFAPDGAGRGLGSSLTFRSQVCKEADMEAGSSCFHKNTNLNWGREVNNMDYQKLILAGNTTSDAQRRKSKKGDVTYTTFNVAVGAGKDRTTFFPITVFGKHGEAIAKYLTKGRQVLVEGRVDVSDNGRFNVIADQVRLGTPTEPAKPTPATSTKKK
jgi:hypothetical protein